MDIKPKKSTNTCHPENSTGWTNGGLEEPVEEEITKDILILFNHLTSATIVKTTTKGTVPVQRRAPWMKGVLLNVQWP